MSSRILLRGGCVLTLGPKTSNLTEADVLIEDGVIAEVGRGLRAREAEPVEAADTIVMPGFVDTHRHTWTSLFRNLGDGVDGAGASLSATLFRDRLGPDDVYAATLVGLLSALEAGITTVVDWCELPLDETSAEAALRAHADAGIRTVFVHAAEEDGGRGASATRVRLARLTAAAGPATTIALGSSPDVRAGLDATTEGWAHARELGLRIFAHAGSNRSGPGAVAALASAGLLGEDVTLVHHVELDEGDLEALTRAGASVSLAPSSEMAEGLGAPPIQALIDRDIRPGLGVDRERVTPGDLFAQMRAAISIQHATVFDRKLAGKAGLPRLLSTRDVIRWATSDGAHAVGLGRVTGSLEPGMRADLIVLRTDRPNIFPINDPIGAVVWGMDTSNVHHVFVDGRATLREGALVADRERVRRSATEARDRVAAAAGLIVGAVSGAGA